ncbi:hypothetical protein SteCoe_14541 [Stentor coeruleus]|uniref:Protein kinase domain-containing protein n=1 Tax=Stentor coeruleus TaxID=5963 RepID=A0A1R2C5S7_9CILI|nr:hypothetical protein SteCoe_14541 [Stentor coeruleus]
MDSSIPVRKVLRTIKTPKALLENTPLSISTPKIPPAHSRPLTAISQVKKFFPLSFKDGSNKHLTVTPLQTQRALSSTPKITDIKPLIKNKIENYAIGKQLGQGAYATVCLATHKKTKEVVAIKIYDKFKLTDTRKKSGVKREIHIMKLLDHPNTIKLYEVLDTNKTVNLVMECISGISLHSYIKKQASKRLHEEEAKTIFKQIVQAVSYCHSKNIVHRDLKLENIMLDREKNVKLIDFGFSTINGIGQMSKVFCGTPSYMAPEIVKNVDYIGQLADIWALGILLFAILTGTFPFKGSSDRDLFKKIEMCKFVVPEFVDACAGNIIKRILHKAPIERPSCDEILQEAWLQG